MKLCCVDGCGLEASRVGAQMCELHYMRVRRHGDTDRRSTLIQGSLLHTQGYLLLYEPDHPLRRRSPRVYAQRVVYHHEHGDGPFNCHWCGCKVTWDDMHVDHVDDNKQNNEPANLVASCPPCNQKRGKWKVVRSHRERTGLTVNGKTRTLNEWSAEVGLARSAIQDRLRKGWTPEEAVLTPRGPSGPKGKGGSKSLGVSAP